MDPAAILGIRERLASKRRSILGWTLCHLCELSPSVFLTIFRGTSFPVSLAVDLGLQNYNHFWQSVPDAGRTTAE